MLTVIPETSASRGQAAVTNEDGVVAGWYTVDNPTGPGIQRRLFTWGDGDGFQVYDELPEFVSDIVAMNNNKQIIGHVGTLLDGWVWEDGQYHFLPDLDGGGDSSMRDINEAGVIVGASYIDQHELRAAKWVEKEIVALATPTGFERSVAVAINDNGWIVGDTYEVPSTYNSKGALLWYEDEPYFLDDLIADETDLRMQRSVAISNSGDILAVGVSESGLRQHVILTLVPEPAGSTYAIAGVFVILHMRRKRRAS